jgi:hypothetical protein
MLKLGIFMHTRKVPTVEIGGLHKSPWEPLRYPHRAIVKMCPKLETETRGVLRGAHVPVNCPGYVPDYLQLLYES